MSRRLAIEHVPVADLKPYGANARVHSPKQVAQIAASIRTSASTIRSLSTRRRHHRRPRPRRRGEACSASRPCPCVRLEHLTEAQKRAYILADNKLAEKAGWDREILAIELQHLTTLDLDFDVTVTGFEMAEIDLLLGEMQSGEGRSRRRRARARPPARRSRARATSGRSAAIG